MFEPAQQAIYDDNGRTEVRPLLPPGRASALDVGCGPGGFGRTLREVYGPTARIVGVEATEEQAAVAAVDHGFDVVHRGYFPRVLEDSSERFDVITFNDVLEHIWEPWDVLRQTHDHLTPGGHVVAAIPSIQYFPVVTRLLRGRWDYEDGGTLDRTHCRFFTRATMVEMFEAAGYEVEECVGANSMYAFARYKRFRKYRRLIRDMEWMHFVVRARSLQAPPLSDPPR